MGRDAKAKPPSSGSIATAIQSLRTPWNLMRIPFTNVTLARVRRKADD
jgi:hypothetical protein